jgi:two-component system, OmpR family, response regulator MtrA
MKPRLLVIDDNRGIAKVMGRIADHVGVDLRIIYDPMLAVEGFVALKPDVVLLDLVMPEKDGIDVLEEILQTGIPAEIILACKPGDGLVQLAEAAARGRGRSCLGVARKPFEVAEVETLLRQAIAA